MIEAFAQTILALRSVAVMFRPGNPSQVPFPLPPVFTAEVVGGVYRTNLHEILSRTLKDSMKHLSYVNGGHPVYLRMEKNPLKPRRLYVWLRVVDSDESTDEPIMEFKANW